MASQSDDRPASSGTSSVYDVQEEGQRGPTGIIQIGLDEMNLQGDMNSTTADNLAAPLASSRLENVTSMSRAPSAQPEQQADSSKNPEDHRRMESLLVTFAEQQALLLKQQTNLAGGSDAENAETGTKDAESSTDTSLVTPDTDSVGGSSSRQDGSTTQGQGPSSTEPAEVLRLQRELEEAKQRIARMDLELSQNRITQHTIEQGLGSPSAADFRVPLPLDVSEQTISDLQGVLNASSRGPITRQPTSWAPPEEPRPNTNDALTVAPFGKPLDIWGNTPARSNFQSDVAPSVNVPTINVQTTDWATSNSNNVPTNNVQAIDWATRNSNNVPTNNVQAIDWATRDSKNVPTPDVQTIDWTTRNSNNVRDVQATTWVTRNGDSVPPFNLQAIEWAARRSIARRSAIPDFPAPGTSTVSGTGLISYTPQPQRAVSGPQFQNHGDHGRGLGALSLFPSVPTQRRGQTQVGRGGSSYNQRGSSWGSYSTNSGPGDNFVAAATTVYEATGRLAPLTYQPAPIGTPLSPTAPEFTSTRGQNNNPWFAQQNSASSSPGQTYVSPIEPLNYRRLLDRTVNCNWKYIVDKIVCNNDQQASIFLQQKLKIGSPEQKYDIVEAIAAQAYPLMVNRFGNFLVQRCFEHGAPDQVIAIANAIRGNTLNLSMDSFGCHVVQKAFDCVPEDYKAIMVHELLRRIPETVIHRYACHVWQKLFELRWNDSPPQIMKYVNEALRGMWHEVALGETGSLVVQNIFENCLEEDKRPCINEVLASIDLIARGQFGNWCIQHICEQGLPADRSRAIDHVLRNCVEYSMDQFASKVVEKCLKIGGHEFLERYLERVCEGRPDRPRIPLVDIASDQYGNYLIQYILTSANPTHREIVASHVRKHMVSLRGSKFGAKVGMLCCNPAYATRPGPGVGPYVNRFNPQNVPTPSSARLAPGAAYPYR